MKYGPVAIARCSSYQNSVVDGAVLRCLELLGGIDRYIKPGMKVLLKCNLLSRRRPDEGLQYIRLWLRLLLKPFSLWVLSRL